MKKNSLLMKGLAKLQTPILGLPVATALLFLLPASGNASEHCGTSAAASPGKTTSCIQFSKNPATVNVSLTITGTTTHADIINGAVAIGQPVGGGQLRIERAMSGLLGTGQHTTCESALSFAIVDSENPTDGTLPTNVTHTTIGTFGYRVQYIGNGYKITNPTPPPPKVNVNNSFSSCVDLVVSANDPPCHNNVGDTCAGLSKGAYGNAGSVAHCTSPGCNPWNNSGALVFDGIGFIPEVGTVFDEFSLSDDSNATTIGRHDILISVTIDDPATLLTALPGGGEPAAFNEDWVKGDVHYPADGPISHFVGKSKTWNGDGAGNLAEQAMTASLNSFLSGKPGGLWAGGVGNHFGDFDVPAAVSGVVPLFCTTKTRKEYNPPGPNLSFGDADDVAVTTSCQASRYPACVAGKTVSQVLAAADSFLARQTVTDEQLVNCTASELSTALDLFNTQFDEQGVVIACPLETATVTIVPSQGGTPFNVTGLGSYLSAPGKATYYDGSTNCPAPTP